MEAVEEKGFLGGWDVDGMLVQHLGSAVQCVCVLMCSIICY